MAIFAKYAYEARIDVVTLLALRFLMAATLFWGAVLRGGLEIPPRRLAAAGLLLGLAGYSAQAGFFFTALTRIDASLASLLLYAYPAMVMLVTVLWGRERPDLHRLMALVVASAGVVLVLSGGAGDDVDGIGVLLALGAAVAYTTYILGSDALVRDVQPIVFSALVCTGAATTFTVAALVGGGVNLGFEPWGWGVLVAMALISTFVAVSTFFAGLSRVGPATASILSTVEPLVTVLLAFVFLGERLRLSQALGGGLVLAAVLLLQLRRRVTRTEPPPDAVPVNR